MLIDLERHFTNKGWYAGTHVFLTISLEGGFEAFSGRATETWEYRWVIHIKPNEILCIPELKYEGKRNEKLDDCCDKILKTLIEYEKNIP